MLPFHDGRARLCTSKGFIYYLSVVLALSHRLDYMTHKCTQVMYLYKQNPSPNINPVVFHYFYIHNVLFTLIQTQNDSSRAYS